MAGDAAELFDFEQQGITVTVEAEFDQPLHMSGLFTFAPEALA